MYDDAYTRNNDGELAVRTVSTTGDTGTNVNDVYTRDANGKLCLRVTGSGGGGGGDQHNLGYYATQAALEEAHPTAVAGDWAIVGATDTVWIWDTDNSEWVDSDQKGQVTSVNGRTGAVTVSEVPSQTGYSGRVLGTDGEVAGWVVPEKVQRSTMPQASEEEAGNIYQYIGTTNANYTNGYFYKCGQITSGPTVTIAQTTGSSLSNLSVDPIVFESAYISGHWGPAEGGEVYFTAFVQTGTRWFDSALPAGVSITGNLESFFTAKGASVEEGSAGSIMIIPGASVNINVYSPTESTLTIPTTVEELASYGVTVTNPDNVFVFCQFRYFTGTESGWVYGDGVNNYVDMAEIGISYEGTPVDGDVITAVYTAESTSYAWTRVDVQPSGSGGGGIEWATSVDLPADYSGSPWAAAPVYTIVGGLPTGSYEFYFQTRCTTEESVVFNVVTYRVLLTINNEERTYYGEAGYVMDGNWMPDGNYLPNDDRNLWFIRYAGSDLIFYSGDMPWVSDVPGYAPGLAVKDCFRLSKIVSLDDGTEYTAIGAFNDGQTPVTDGTYDGYVQVRALMHLPQAPNYYYFGTHGYSDEQQYLFTSVVIPGEGYDDSNVAEADITLRSGDSTYHAIINTAVGSYTARVLEATGMFANTQLGEYDRAIYIYLNTASGTSGTIEAQLGLKGSAVDATMYIATPPEFNQLSISSIGYAVDANNFGTIEQYKGATDQNYTNGYFYKASGTKVVVPESAVCTEMGQSVHTIAITDLDGFINVWIGYTGWSKEQIVEYFIPGYIFTYDYNANTLAWSLFDGAYDATDFLPYLSFSPAASDDDVISWEVEYTPGGAYIQNGHWERIDVQPLDLTGITGYDATKTQVLKNVQGTISWVDE